jgi:hypothetical protein
VCTQLKNALKASWKCRPWGFKLVAHGTRVRRKQQVDHAPNHGHGPPDDGAAIKIGQRALGLAERDRKQFEHQSCQGVKTPAPGPIFACRAVRRGLVRVRALSSGMRL